MRNLHALPLASALFLSSLGALFAAPMAGCSTQTDDDSAAAEQASTADDLATAKSVVAMLGGTNGACKQCHNVSLAAVKQWGTAMKNVDTACFADTSLTAKQRVDCLRSTPGVASSPFSAKRLGLYAAGAKGSQFRRLFASAFTGGTAELSDFTSRVAMPRGGNPPLSDNDFATLKGWVLKGMPQLEQAFGAPGPTPPSVCTPKTTPELAAHIQSMKANGWGARLADQATPMYGCGTATGTGCLAQLPDDTTTFGAMGVAQKLRRLHSQPLSSHWWVRSSADGRYVGYGMNDSAKIVDLTKPVASAQRTIKVRADYDPLFLPSNDGFAFAGTTGDAIRLCRQSLLADVGSAASPFISLTEAKCASVGESVYMSIGTALDGERYFMTFGTHENDDGGNDVTSPLPAAFGPTASTLVTPMVNDGQSYRAQASVTVNHPGEGDMMLSPSSLLAGTRFGDGQKPKGYRVRFLKTTPSTTDAPAVTIPLAAEVCVQGQKPSFSFDERFMVTHQYVDRTIPDQAALPAGSSNIILVDLLTGKTSRITTTKAGEFALYPHFRADGWLYFIVRDMNQNKEYVVASDVALRVE